MITYLEQQRDRLPQEELAKFLQVRAAVQRLPDRLDLGRDVVLSCHVLARAVGRVFKLRVEDGFFHPTFQHSWLVTPSGCIIDVYPVGIVGGPIIADRIHRNCDGLDCRRRGLPVYGLYVPLSTRFISRGRFSSSGFRHAVRVVELSLLRQL